MTLALGITAPLVSVTVPEIEPLENWPNKDELKKRAARSRPKMRLTTLAWRFPFTWGSCSVVNLYMDPLAPFPASKSTCQLGTAADKPGTGGFKRSRYTPILQSTGIRSRRPATRAQ